MNFQESRIPSLPSARREAGEILARRGNRLLLIEAILLVMLNLPLYIFWNSAVTLCTELVKASVSSARWNGLIFALYGLLTALTVLFLTLPSLIGLFGFAKRIASGEHPTLSELFEPFSSAKGYARTLRIAWSTFWRLELTVSAVFLTFRLLLLAADAGFPPFLCSLILFAEIVGAILLWIRRFSCLAIALSRRDSAAEGRMPSRDLSGHTYRAAFRFFLGFLPWILLGLVTFGILLLWDVLPRMLIAYFRYLDQK